MYSLPVVLALMAASANAHTVGWKHGMYCEGGPDPNNYNSNSDDAVLPLYQLNQTGWFYHGMNGCNLIPPRDSSNNPTNDSVALPANGAFWAENAHNQGQTSLSFNCDGCSQWPDGQQHPDDWSGPGNPPECIQDDGAMHASNQSTASATSWGISYKSDPAEVTMDDIVIFSVAYNTPWLRNQTYYVPDLPPCPADGCICSWHWVPNGCGQPNMYFSPPYRCHVVNGNPSKTLGKPVPPVYCGNDTSNCITGAKQPIVWNQLEGDNVVMPPNISPLYNAIMGFPDGAQTGIFVN